MLDFLQTIIETLGKLADTDYVKNTPHLQVALVVVFSALAGGIIIYLIKKGRIKGLKGNIDSLKKENKRLNKQNQENEEMFALNRDLQIVRGIKGRADQDTDSVLDEFTTSGK